MIHDDDVRAVRTAANIVGVVSEYVQLRRVGRRWVGLCPFHPEKSPSFSVNEQDGLYYCFGCQAKGDVITFVRELEGVDFTGAVERLAGRAGVTLRYTDQVEGESRKRRSQLSDLVDRAATWYHERLLTAPEAGQARAYLRSRGLDKDEVLRFRIGWAPEGWDELARQLRVGDDLWRDSGLGTINRRGRQQDFFRGRVVFPIFDPQGAAIGFGGRLLPGSGDREDAGGRVSAPGAKYVNPTATPLYDKSRVLYGLNWAKADIVRAQEAVVCEGYTDVIGFFAAGVERAVATCGTALTEDHVRLLTRFAKRLLLAFDADGAGQAAAERFHQWERTYDLDVRVVVLPEGSDPDTLARSDPEALRRAVAEAVPFLKFRLGRIWSAADLSSVEGRARAAGAALEVLAAHPDPIVREQYLFEIAARARVDAEVLRSQLAGRSRPTSAPSGRSRPDRSDPGAAPSHGPDDDPAWASLERRPPASRPRGVAPISAVELDALRVTAEDPAAATEWLDAVLFTAGPNRRAFEVLVEHGALGPAIERLAGGEGDDPADDTAEEHADAAAAEVLHRVAVEQSDATVEEVFLRLCQEVTRRLLAERRDAARAAVDPLAGAAEVQTLSGWRATLIDDTLPLEARQEAGTALLTWLLSSDEPDR